MLRKLMKYEFMATGRIVLPFFAALVVISIVNRLLAALPVSTPAIIGTIVSVILIVGIAVLTLILTLQRFRNNLLSNEGYLMMTLPVCTDRIILSKLFVASIWSAASFIVVMLSILIMALTDFDFSELITFIRGIYELFASNPLHSVIYVIEFTVIAALTLFAGILMLYACMSLSMLVNKRRGLFTFGAFVVISTSLQILFAIVGSIAVFLDINVWFNNLDLAQFGLSQVVIINVLVIEAVLCALFYLITRYMLKNRLNLQ